MRRKRESEPYSASASTQAQGTPPSSAAAISAQAICGLVANVTLSGIWTRLRLASSSDQASGRYTPRSRQARAPSALLSAQSPRTIQPPIDQCLAETARIAQEYADLAVLHSPRGARILP